MKFKKMMIVCLFILMLSSCAGNGAELLDFMSNEMRIDYGGYEVYYLAYIGNPSPDTHALIYDTTTIQGDEMLKRLHQIKNDYNIIVTLDSSKEEPDYEMAHMAGNVRCDILHLFNLNAMQHFASNGFLYPLTDFPEYIDLSDTDKYGGANVIESTIVNSIPYSVQPLYWFGFQAVDECILAYNIELLKSNNITDLHEFYENKTWTWDTFEKEYLEKFSSINQDKDFLPIGIESRYLIRSMIHSNNVQFIVKNDAGENVTNLNSKEFITAYDKAVEWLSKYIPSDPSWRESHSKFMEGSAGIVYTSGYDVTEATIIYSDFEYGLMPFPCGPDSPYGRWANVSIRTKGAGISTASLEPEIAAFTLSQLFEPFEAFGGRNGLYDYFKEYIFLSETDADIFFDMAQYLRQNYNYMDGNSVGYRFEETFGDAARRGISASEALGQHMYILEDMVVKYMLPNYDYMYEHYYSKLD